MFKEATPHSAGPLTPRRTLKCDILSLSERPKCTKIPSGGIQTSSWNSQDAKNRVLSPLEPLLELPRRPQNAS